MELILVSFLITITSAIGYGVISRIRPFTGGTLYKAIAGLLDWAGLFTLFMGANLVLGVLIVLLFRGLTPNFVSMYQLESLFLLILSAAQAFVFCQSYNRA